MAGPRRLEPLVRPPADLAEQSVYQYARRQAGRLDEVPPQPTADVNEMLQPTAGLVSTAANVDHSLANAGLDRLWNYAQVYSPRSGQGYRVNDVNLGPDVTAEYPKASATMTRLTLDQYLAAQYGDDWPKVKAAMQAAGHSAPVNYQGPRTLQEHLTSPISMFVSKDPAMRSHFTGTGRAIMMSPRDIKGSGSAPAPVVRHEFGHAVAPMDSRLLRGNTDGLPLENMKSLLLGEFPELKDRPLIAQSGAGSLEYRSQTREVPPDLFALRQMHYGITGDPLLKPEDRLRFLQQIESAPKADIGKPAMRTRAWFPDDPVMKHGPHAGEKADGYQNFLQFMRMILPRLDNQQKGYIWKTFNQGASTQDPNEAVHA